MTKPDYPKLSNPPIMLAILQVLFDFPENFELDNYIELKHVVSEKFPEFNKSFTGEVKIQDVLDGKPVASIKDHRVSGYFFGKKDKSSDFMVEQGKFTFNQHGNYKSWEEFVGEVKFALNHTFSLINKVTIKRISFRCINRIEVLESVSDPSEYFNVSLLAKKDCLPDQINSYLINYKYNWGENKDAIISQNAGPLNNGVFPFIFDIDVLDRNSFEYDEELFWQKYSEIRNVKDDIFFRSISEKTLDLLR